jgi:hypothetical protein
MNYADCLYSARILFLMIAGHMGGSVWASLQLPTGHCALAVIVADVREDR